MTTHAEYEQQQELKEQLEHRDVLLAIGVLLKMKEGKQFFKYLMKSLDVGTVPEEGLEGFPLHNYLGFLRAGNSIYKLICEADFEEAALLLSKIEREKYDDLCEQYKLNTDTNDYGTVE